MSKYLEVLTPQNSQLIFIDQEPQMASRMNRTSTLRRSRATMRE